MLTRGAHRRGGGFTLIELLVVITLASALLALAMPAFSGWTRNAQVRTVTEALQTGLRLAQAEAVRRNRQVVFFLTDATACTNAIGATEGGAFWAIRTVPLVAGEAAETVQCGQLGDVAAGVGIDGPVALCFNSAGRLATNPAPGPAGAACEVDADEPVAEFDVAVDDADRPLRVLVALGGQVRMCDPARTFSRTNPDGCPV